MISKRKPNEFKYIKDFKKKLGSLGHSRLLKFFQIAPTQHFQHDSCSLFCIGFDTDFRQLRDVRPLDQRRRHRRYRYLLYVNYCEIIDVMVPESTIFDRNFQVLKIKEKLIKF